MADAFPPKQLNLARRCKKRKEKKTRGLPLSSFRRAHVDPPLRAYDSSAILAESESAPWAAALPSSSLGHNCQGAFAISPLTGDWQLPSTSKRGLSSGLRVVGLWLSSELANFGASSLRAPGAQQLMSMSAEYSTSALSTNVLFQEWASAVCSSGGSRVNLSWDRFQ